MTCEERELVKKKLTLEDVMIEIGSFNRFQLKSAIIIGIAVIINSLQRFDYIFTTARIPTRCFVPECDDVIPEFTPSWLEKAIPKNKDGFEECHRYVVNLNESKPLDNTCTVSLFNASATQQCTSYVYENQNTVVYDFDLACDEWRRSLIGCARFVGGFCGLQIIGCISDKFGRKSAFLICAVVFIVFGMIRSIASSYYMFVAFMFFEQFLGGGVTSVSFILLSEIVNKKYRAKMAAVFFIALAFGYSLLGVIAWFVKSWRLLLRIIYGPGVILLSYYWLLNESVRWLQSRGRYDDADNILRKIANVNNRSISDSTLVKLRESLEEEKCQTKTKDIPLPILVFKHKKILLRCVLLPLCWITCTLIYYGTASNALYLRGNGYLNYLTIVFAEIMAYVSIPFVLDRVGRKPVLISGYLTCAMCMVTHIFLDVNILIYTGLYCDACVLMTLYLYTSELFPTKYRNRLFGFTSMMGRIGSVMAPIVPYLEAEIWKHLPTVIFAGLSAVSAFVITLLPETLGRTLPETMEEANDMENKSRP